VVGVGGSGWGGTGGWEGGLGLVMFPPVLYHLFFPVLLFAFALFPPM